MGMDWKTVEMVFSVEFWRMGLLWTLSLLYSYFLVILGEFFGFNIHPLPSYSRASCDSLLQTGRPLCIITGATSGLGAAAAKALSGKGYHVILAGRSLQQISKTMREIKQQNNEARLQGFQVDMSSIHSIMEFKTSIDKWLLDSNLPPSVQLLINNAGILATSCRVTADGYDEMMETNYIGPFVLTNLLLPLLKNSPLPSRIVNVTSFTHRCVPSNAQVDREALTRRCSRYQLDLGKYPFGCTYEYSKFCILLFTYELHRKLYLMDPSTKISVIAADPGVVETNIMRELPQHLSQLAFTVLRFMYLLQSPENGVDSIIDAALAPPEASGKYFFGGKRRTLKSSLLSYNSRLAEELWASSCKLISEAEFGLQISRDYIVN